MFCLTWDVGWSGLQDEDERMATQLPSIKQLMHSLPKVYLLDNSEDTVLEVRTSGPRCM